MQYNLESDNKTLGERLELLIDSWANPITQKNRQPTADWIKEARAKGLIEFLRNNFSELPRLFAEAQGEDLDFILGVQVYMQGRPMVACGNAAQMYAWLQAYHAYHERIYPNKTVEAGALAFKPGQEMKFEQEPYRWYSDEEIALEKSQWESGWLLAEKYHQTRNRIENVRWFWGKNV